MDSTKILAICGIFIIIPIMVIISFSITAFNHATTNSDLQKHKKI